MSSVADELKNFRFCDKTIPEYMHHSISEYVDRGTPPGDFLRSVLCNNLRDAVVYADDTNMWLLPVYTAFIHDNAPSECWGTKAKVYEWMALKQTEYKNEKVSA